MAQPITGAKQAPQAATRPLSLGDLREHPHNPRKIDDEALAGLTASLAKFGDISGIVWNRSSGCLVAGHQRLRALRARYGEGLRLDGDAVVAPSGERFPVRVVEWDEDTAVAAMVVANSEMIAGDWSADIDTHLAKLRSTLPPTEFLALRLGDLTSGLKSQPVPPNEDDAPPVPSSPTTNAGDLWLLGDHRLLCGDSTKASDRLRLMGDERAAAVFTDPPYAIYGSSTGIAADICDDKMVRPFFLAVAQATQSALKPFGHAYICCDWRSWGSWWEVVKGTGLVPKNMIVWDKGGGLGGMYANCHELLMFCSNRPLRNRMTQKIKGERTVNGANVWRINRAGRDETGAQRSHNAQKPVGLVTLGMNHSTDRGDLVVDWFLGSGTTLIACEQRERLCRGLEVEAGYCDVIVERWQNLTGGKAKRQKA